MMHSTNNDAKNDINDDSNPQKQQTNTSPIISNSSLPCSTLLVIDDTSDSEDEIITDNQDSDQNISSKNILNKLMPTNITAQLSNMQIPTNIVPPTHDFAQDTVDQKRRRNSSIAKILGGQPLHNQQYDEIHQQILESQSAQNANNNYDAGTDNDNQRSRSSITRTLLQNTEQTNSLKKIPTSKVPLPSGPSFSKDFEYLIRHELDKIDIEHGSGMIQRHNSASNIIPTNVQSSANTDVQLKLKRKRVNLKPSSFPSSNIPPFSLHNPSDLESTAINQRSSEDPHSNQYLHFDSTKRVRYFQQQPPPINISPLNHSSYHNHNNPLNSSIYNQLNIRQDLIRSNNHSPTHNCPLSPPPVRRNVSATSIRKTKSMLVRSDDRSRQRPYFNMSNQSNPSSVPSSKVTVPLKKRLLDAYNNEHPPTSSL